MYDLNPKAVFAHERVFDNPRAVARMERMLDAMGIPHDSPERAAANRFSFNSMVENAVAGGTCREVCQAATESASPTQTPPCT